MIRIVVAYSCVVGTVHCGGLLLFVYGYLRVAGYWVSWMSVIDTSNGREAGSIVTERKQVWRRRKQGIVWTGRVGVDVGRKGDDTMSAMSKVCRKYLVCTYVTR
jgi:hypothetical protein